MHNETLIFPSSAPHPYVGRRLRLPFIKSWINSQEQPPDVCFWYFKDMEMLSDKTKLICINQLLEKSLFITTRGCVAKEYTLLVPKIPVRSGCCSSFRLCLYLIPNTIVQTQQIYLTQYTSSDCINITTLNIKPLSLDFLCWVTSIPLNLEIVILLSYVFVLLPIQYLNAKSSPLLFSINTF